MLRDTLRMTRTLAIGVLLGMAGASCRVSGTRSNHTDVEGDVAGSHTKLVFFPSTERLFANGRIQDGKQVGLWQYYSWSGALLLEGSFSDEGLASGPWVAFAEDGTVNARQTCWEETEDGNCAIYCPVASDTGWREADGESRRRLFAYLPGNWSGSGHYSNGKRCRDLGEQERVEAQAARP